MDKISIIISLKNRTRFKVEYEPIQLKTFMRHEIEYSGLEKKPLKLKGQNIELELLIEHLKSLEKLNYNFEIIIVDFNSDDFDVYRLIEIFPKLNLKIKKINDYFSRGRGLNEGYDISTGTIIFFSDADMLFSSDELFISGLREIRRGKVFFPICFDLIDPTHQLGYWRKSGYGLFMVSRKLIEENQFRWPEYNSLGKEDDDSFDALKKFYARYNVKGYYHQWHPSSKLFKNQNYKHSDYDKTKVLINFKNNDNYLKKLIALSQEYYFTDKLEMDINLVCNDKKRIFNQNDLNYYQEKFNRKIDIISKKDLIQQLENKINKTIVSYSYKPIWLQKVLNWMSRIENKNYTWTLQGTKDHKLSACSLFGKLAKIYSNYRTCNVPKLERHIKTYLDKRDGMFKQDKEELKIISESRQAYSGLINLGLDFKKKIDIDKYYQKPLFFMNDKAWENPWSAGAQLSHYVFFCHILNKNEEINQVFKDLEKYETDKGWLFGNPKPERIVNGMMKVFTAFDVVGKEAKPEMLKNLANYLLEYNEFRGGCGIYDYVYCLLKCYKIDYRKNEIKKKLYELYDLCLEHQMDDGGFKYSSNPDKVDKYSGKEVNTPGLHGSIHATTLYSMALTMLNNELDFGLNLELAFS